LTHLCYQILLEKNKQVQVHMNLSTFKKNKQKKKTVDQSA